MYSIILLFGLIGANGLVFQGGLTDVSKRHMPFDCIPREVTLTLYRLHPSVAHLLDPLFAFQVHLALSESTDELRLVWVTTADG